MSNTNQYVLQYHHGTVSTNQDTLSKINQSKHFNLHTNDFHILETAKQVPNPTFVFAFQERNCSCKVKLINQNLDFVCSKIEQANLCP